MPTTEEKIKKLKSDLKADTQAATAFHADPAGTLVKYGLAEAVGDVKVSVAQPSGQPGGRMSQAKCTYACGILLEFKQEG
jgi:hypothetical protein